MEYKDDIIFERQINNYRLKKVYDVTVAGSKYRDIDFNTRSPKDRFASNFMLRFLMYDHIVVIALLGTLFILYFNRRSFTEEQYKEYMIFCYYYHYYLFNNNTGS